MQTLLFFPFTSARPTAKRYLAHLDNRQRTYIGAKKDFINY